jgi:three-Cys-motif partner protein
VAHSAGREFFKEKKSWSRRKDMILEGYLPEYIPRLIHAVKKPVCIVDGFAGPGSFEVGDEPGSPRIICEIVQKARDNPANFGTTITPYFVERDPELYQILKPRLGSFRGVELRNLDFRLCVRDIVERAKRESVFVYLDPFTVEALEWSSLDQLFVLLSQNVSLEVLMNFNVATFARIGLGALGMAPAGAVEADDEAGVQSTPSAESLSRVAGGEWWLEILKSPLTFEEQCRRITDAYCEQLRSRFKEVCFHEIKDKVNAKQPKYVLVFATRSPVALGLMNDKMAASLERFADEARPPAMLFETLPESVVPDRSKLGEIILRELGQPMTRRDLVLAVIRKNIARFTQAEIREGIKSLAKARMIKSDTGTRLNDESIVERGPIRNM